MLFKSTLATLLFSFISISVFGQFDYGCNGSRYINEEFSDFAKETVLFGQNENTDGTLQDLYMDVFYPVNDDADARPLIIMAHSGSFINGERSEMHAFCERLSKLGYVAATIDYRLLNIANGIPDSIAAMDIAVKASHDMKGAIRWFMHSAIDENPYNIDPDMLFVGGYSAGAIVALTTGLIDEGEVSQDFLATIFEDNGGIQGDTGNPDYLEYDYDIKGIINMSGAIYDIAWIDENDPIILGVHGDQDAIVPFAEGWAMVFGIKIVPLRGSELIYNKTLELEVPGYFLPVEGADHTNIYIEDAYEDVRNTFIGHTDTTFATIICGSLVSSFTDQNIELSVYPNPTTGYLIIEGAKDGGDIRFYNTTGQKVFSSSINTNGSLQLPNDLVSGMYYYQLMIDGYRHTGSVILE